MLDAPKVVRIESSRAFLKIVVIRKRRARQQDDVEGLIGDFSRVEVAVLLDLVEAAA